MNLAKALGLFLAFLLNATFLSGQSIFINEFMASNSQTIADENGEFDDWVEIYNAGSLAIDLGGKFVTDDLSNPTKWQIPTTNPNMTTIQAGAYLIIWFDGDTEQGELHVSPKLGGGGEQIGMYDADGITPLDTLTYGAQLTDVSEGRFPDGSTSFVNFTNPSPGATNPEPLSETVVEPNFSQAGGLYNSPVDLTMSTTTDGASIYYTVDGSDPNENSIPFNNAISISATQVVRARAFKDGLIPSAIITNTYFINSNHAFPIVAISGDPDKFFGAESGLFPNYEQDLEVPLNVELYETDGTQGFNQVAEVEIHGSASAILDQKSLAIKAKGSLGNSTIDYAVFPNEDRDQYRSLILRNSGQDWEYTMFRDALESSLVADLADVSVEIEQPDLDDQAYRPAIAYLNGEYWGIYNLRERSDKRYIRAHYGLDDDEIDLLENLDEAKEGDFLAWNSLDSLLRAKSFTDEAGLNELAALADLDNYMDYIIHNIFIDNTDWPGNNYLRWRERVPEGKWRWMTKDLDYGFGFLELDTDNFNTGNPNINSLDRMLNPGLFFPNPDWGTILFNRLMENPVWKRDFINRMADQLNVLFSRERMLQFINDFQANYQPEINQHNQKWQNVWTWNQDVDVLRTFAEGRTAAVRNHFIESIPEVGGISELTLRSIPSNGGNIRISTLTTNQNNNPWTGTYFNDIDIPIQAIASPGYKFSGWSANVNSSSENTTININGDISIAAIFVPDNGQGEPTDQTIDFPEIADKSVEDSPFSATVNASSGLPVSLSIISGPATISGNTITLNGTPGTVTVQASQAGNDLFNPAPNVTQVFEVSNLPPMGGAYCDGSGQEPWQEYIANVQFVDIDNPSGKDSYGNFLSQSTNITKGESYPITLTPGFSWAHYEEAFTVWIDWNQDEDFTDFGEEVYSSNFAAGVNGTIANPIEGIISVPANATTGNTRMRVAMQRNEPISPCGTFTLGEMEDYSIQVIGDDPIGLAANCPESIIVNIASGENGAIINWEAVTATTNCPNGINAIVQTGGQSNGSFFPLGSAIIEYTITDNCGNTTTCDFEVRVAIGNTITYCPAKGNKPWQEYIANVNLNTLDNSSFKEQYGNFTNLSTTLQPGTEYEISLTPGFSYFQWNEAFQVWIDYNRNGSFEDAGELVYAGLYNAQTGGSTPEPLIGSFTVPNGVSASITRMRVAMKRDDPASSCENFEIGEVEDYSIQISGANRSNSRASYLNFTAFNVGRAIELQWLTNTATESEYFVLEHASNGIDFSPIKYIDQFADKNLDAFFKELDTNPLVGDNYYRLQQYFKDGSSIYSPIQVVKFKVDLEQVLVFPNPAKDRLNVQLNEFGGQAGRIQLFDAFGRLQKNLEIGTSSDPLISISLLDLSDGLYYLKIIRDKKRTINKKVIVNRFY